KSFSVDGGVPSQAENVADGGFAAIDCVKRAVHRRPASVRPCAARRAPHAARRTPHAARRTLR
ncbi:MAG: hypothetical protein QOE57_1836, partial [Acidimicrobiaceae bacterium]|nr:hypothetical protein [Acidimicrobiaceae bacterium]